MKKYYDLQTLDINLQRFRKNGAFKRNSSNLSDADLSVLFCIKFHHDDEKIKLTDISQRLELTLPAITHKVNDLEQRGLVLKVVPNDDKRVINLELTNEAEKIVSESLDPYYKPLVKLVNHLSKEEVKTLNNLLEKANKLGKL